MARRTVEDFNGFVTARPTAKKPATVRAPGRPKPATSGGKKTVPVPKSKTDERAPTPTKKNISNTRPFSQVEKPQRIAAGKKLPVNVKTKQEENKIEQNKVKIVRKEDKTTEKTENTSIDRSSEVSDDQEYEDDFEDYESDFESDSSIDSTSLVPPSQPIAAIDQPVSVDSAVKFALPVCVEEKLEPFLNEKFEVDSLERTIEIGLNNFKTAGKRKREQDAKDKIQTRGNVLMEMIKLDTVSYSLLDLPAIPYEQYIKIYGHSNMTQVQTQTHDDNAEKEVQTNEIDLTEKWTQQPIVLTNGLDCSSHEYQCAKLGVGGTAGTRDGRRLTRVLTVDPDRVIAVGRMMLSMLEQQAMDHAEHRLMVASHLDFSGGYLSPAVSDIKFLVKRPITSIEFARVTSPIESLVTIHQVTDSNHQYVICIWSISNMENPEYVLKCPNRVTSFCTILKSTSGLVAAANADGSICVWDLRESRLHHQNIDRLLCPLRSPSFNTALSTDQGHKSKIVSLSTVTYSNVGATNEEFPDELCSLDEDFVLAVWTVVDSWADGSEISEHKSPGTAPWSSIRLVRTQTFEANKNVPRHLSDGAAATCMFLNNNQDAFVGTNSGLIFRCNLGEHKVRPTYYVHEKTGEHFSINWLDNCPFNSNYFLAACSSNEVILYCTSRRESLRQFFTSPSDPRASTSLTKAQWCTGFPGIVIGLDSLSSVHVWDLCDDTTSPIMSTPFPGKTTTSMSITSTRKSLNTYLGVAFGDGTVEIHQLKLGKRKTDVAENDDKADHCDLLNRFLASL